VATTYEERFGKMCCREFNSHTFTYTVTYYDMREEEYEKENIIRKIFKAHDLTTGNNIFAMYLKDLTG
jgi:hypothetical protein